MYKQIIKPLSLREMIADSSERHFPDDASKIAFHHYQAINIWNSHSDLAILHRLQNVWQTRMQRNAMDGN